MDILRKEGILMEIRTLMQKLKALLLVLCLFLTTFAGVRIKEIAQLQGTRQVQILGYGLVVGLDGTGDSRQSLIANQSVRNMLKHFAITVPAKRMNVRNVAAVIVTANILPFVKVGSRIDVIVSSLGDATSLEGGTLLLTPLMGPDGQIYARAQGAVSIGGFNINTIGGEKVRRNYALVGRVPAGAVLEKEIKQNFTDGNSISIILRNPDFTTADRIAKQVNQTFGNGIAVAKDAAQIVVTIPADYKADGKMVEFVSAIESLEIEPDQIAKVVVNERTGTVVIGENVTVSPVAISHGNLNVQISAMPIISQPAPFSRGQTVVVPQTQTNVETEKSKVMVMENATNVQQIAKALNALGVTSRDIIAIFQALKEVGALKAELIIM